jgi:hypothetical protein
MPVVTSQNREKFIASEMERRAGRDMRAAERYHNEEGRAEKDALRDEERGEKDEHARHDHERKQAHRLADQWHGLHTGKHEEVTKDMKRHEAVHHMHRLMGSSGAPKPEAHEVLSKMLAGMYDSEKREV